MAAHDGGRFFGPEVAARYDESTAEMFDPAVVGPAVDLLAGLAADGRALELGIGTGRIALPLTQRGVTVCGIDASPAMVERLRAKPGGDTIEVAIGDFSTTRLEGGFTVAYLVFNTIFNLVTQDDQVACFENVSAHLEPGGCFVIETGVPALRLLPPGQVAVPFHIGPTHMGFDVYDTVTQRFSSQHFQIGGGTITASPFEFRYAWPAELDLMARIAGMRLRDRWAGWQREPFTADSRSHVSVYEKPSRSNV